jgi:hypothetical protein
MHLVYLDESGNSGNNLTDTSQPVFVLCAMIVEESRWLSLETGLTKHLDNAFPNWRTIDGFEIHGSDLRRGTGQFRGMPVADRIKFRDSWMEIGRQHGVVLICRSVNKKMYGQWLVKHFGQGIVINPHIAAFAFVARCVDNYLKSLPGQPLGMLISDENKEIVTDVEKTIRVFKGIDGAMHLGQIVEKGFFIDSSKSLPLQLCDIYALSIRKKAERVWSATPSKSIDDSGI